MRKIIINDTKIWIHDLESPIIRDDFNGFCAICEKDIQTGDKISLIIGNNLFPGVWVHSAHIVSEYDIKCTIDDIIEKYQKYLSHENERRIWGE